MQTRPVLTAIAGLGLLLFVIVGTQPNSLRIGSDDLRASASSALFQEYESQASIEHSAATLRSSLIDSYVYEKDGDFVLRKTPSYEVIYPESFGYFIVTIQAGDPVFSKAEVEQWLRDWGFGQRDLCNLPVRFVLQTEQLRRLYPSFTSLPTGCPTSSP